MKVYLAGKIRRRDWRASLIHGSHLDEWLSDQLDCTCPSGLEETDIERALQKTWPTLKGVVAGGHDYVGPYFVGCDHGCWHGENSHAIKADGYYFVNEAHRGIGVEPSWRHLVVERCLDSIREADFVFAWIDSPDAYGTLAELGHASAMRIPIAIAGPKHYPDLWFAYELSSTSPQFHPDLTPRQAFETALHRSEPVFLRLLARRDYNAYLQTPHWKKKRAEARERAQHRCQVCNTPHNLHTHHRTYERLGCELPEDLTVLCDSCHARYHAATPRSDRYSVKR